MKNNEQPVLPEELAQILARSHLGTTPLGWVPAADVPQPFHQLLVHDHDMTSELARFHGESISLTVIHSQQTGGTYLREVLLRTETSGNPVEYGLIEIVLGAFPPRLRPLILAGKLPLGVILNASRLAYRSQPQGFFTVRAGALLEVFPQSPGGAILFGRYNHLVCGENNCLARILEILPPAQSQP